MNLEEMKINLRTLWTEDYSKLPDWVDSENVIYKIENLVNHKVYIGQAKWFYGRFVGNGFSHLFRYKEFNMNGSNVHLYNSIGKYKSRNFEVSIIEICDIDSMLDDQEIYWISYYDSFNRGYNMTSGGSRSTDHLHSKESLEKAWNSLASKYNGDYCGQLHTPEANTKAMKTNKANHGGVLAWSTPEAVMTMTLGTLFKSINHCLEDIHTWHPDFKVIDFDIYWWHTPYSSSGAYRHIRRVLDRLPNLRQDPRWTPEMENIFGYIEIHREEYGI